MDYDKLSSLPAMFFANTKDIGNRPFLWAKHDGEWQPTSGEEAHKKAIALSNSLIKLGVSKGDRIVLVSESRPEWMIADIAIMATGAISVPAYTTNQVNDHAHILRDSGAKGAIVSGPALAKNLLPAATEVGIDFIVAIEDISTGSHGIAIHLWDELISRHDGTIQLENDIARTDTSCLIYTSGTGGVPKGVMLSHGAIIANCKGAFQLLNTLGLDDERFLSFLPLSHSYEHTAGLMFPLSIKAQIYYAEGVDKLAANMEEVGPTIMTAVPRLYETMHGRITRGVQQKGGLSEKLFLKAVENGRKKYEGKRRTLGEALLDPLLTRFVRDKIARRFGGKLKAMVSGGAPLNYDIGTFFKALNVPLLQGYGQTESAPIISCNVPKKNKIHTVGPKLVDVDLKIANDGEILVKGELVMQGYWNMPEETAEVIVNGWLHTGDIGELDDDGYLIITDRKKDIIVNAGGDNIAPQRIEGFLTLQPEIAQAMIYGDRKPNLSALILPDPEFTADWAKETGKPTPHNLVDDDGFREAISAAVDRVNADLSVIERVRRFIIINEPFTIENEMMTPSMKIRRHIIKERYGEALEALYVR
ncbi:MAG: AMP-binding protein [Pseudomonadota bacterium]|nr:AMP-binding protein [Pseudomonadota bacterium]